MPSWNHFTLATLWLSTGYGVDAHWGCSRSAVLSRCRRGSILDGDPVTAHVRDFFYVPAYPNSLTRPQGPFVDNRGAIPPPFEVSEGDDGTVHLTMELPGVSSRDLNVELENDHVLRIHGVRVHHRNGRISESKFEHSIRLKDTVDPDRMEANLASGVLTITVPQKPTKIRKLPLSTDERSILDTQGEESIKSSNII